MIRPIQSRNLPRNKNRSYVFFSQPPSPLSCAPLNRGSTTSSAAASHSTVNPPPPYSPSYKGKFNILFTFLSVDFILEKYLITSLGSLPTASFHTTFKSSAPSYSNTSTYKALRFRTLFCAPSTTTRALAHIPTYICSTHLTWARQVRCVGIGGRRPSRHPLVHWFPGCARIVSALMSLNLITGRKAWISNAWE